MLATGEVIRTGGKFVKASTGFDLTQLIIGSEGMLALVTEVTLKLRPRLRDRADAALAVPDARGGDRRGAPSCGDRASTRSCSSTSTC